MKIQVKLIPDSKVEVKITTDQNGLLALINYVRGTTFYFLLLAASLEGAILATREAKRKSQGNFG